MKIEVDDRTVKRAFFDRLGSAFDRGYGTNHEGACVQQCLPDFVCDIKFVLDQQNARSVQPKLLALLRFLMAHQLLMPNVLRRWRV